MAETKTISAARTTRPDDDAITRALALYGIAPAEVRISSLDRGDDNVSVLVSARGMRCVLRLYRITPPAEIPFELELVDFLSSRGFPTPRVRRRSDAGLVVDIYGIPAVLFDYADGDSLTDPHAGEVARIAALYATMHVLTWGKTFAGARSRTDIGRLQTFESFVKTNPRFGRTPGVDEFLAGTKSVLSDWQAALDSADAPVPVGAIHHDPSLGNILVNRDREITALLDFDEAYVGHLVVDVAALLHYWALDAIRTTPGQLLQPSRVRQVIGGYESVRRLTRDEGHLLPAALLVFTAADAADYLTRWWRREPDNVSLDASLSVTVFRSLRESTDWKEQLRREVAR